MTQLEPTNWQTGECMRIENVAGTPRVGARGGQPVRLRAPASPSAVPRPCAAPPGPAAEDDMKCADQGCGVSGGREQGVTSPGGCWRMMWACFVRQYTAAGHSVVVYANYRAMVP